MGAVKRTHPRSRENQQFMKKYHRRGQWRSVIIGLCKANPLLSHRRSWEIFSQAMLDGINHPMPFVVNMVRNHGRQAMLDAYYIGFDLASGPDRTAICHPDKPYDGMKPTSIIFDELKDYHAKEGQP